MFTLQECLSWFWDVHSRSMSPFDHKILNIRTAGSSLEPFGVSIEEGNYLLFNLWIPFQPTISMKLVTCSITLLFFPAEFF